MLTGVNYFPAPWQSFPGIAFHYDQMDRLVLQQLLFGHPPDGRDTQIFLQSRLRRGSVLDDARDLVIRRVHHRFEFAAEVTMPRSEHPGPNFRDGSVRRHRRQNARTCSLKKSTPVHFEFLSKDSRW